jgi:o-succinylbenzoate synthase
MAIRIDKVVVRQVRMPLVHFFETSFGRTYTRDIVLVEVLGNGMSGWGEVTAGENPFYNEEWTASVWPLLTDFVIPRVIGRDLASAADVAPLTAHIRGHRMTRGGLEAAVWDLQSRLNNRPLWSEICGASMWCELQLARSFSSAKRVPPKEKPSPTGLVAPRQSIPCGVSIGVQDTLPALLDKIRIELEAGYQRIKIKIKPGWDVDAVREVRREFPSILLMADANSAYTLAHIDHLRRLDEFGLMMIEQPLAHDDIIDHAKLQAKLQTPICLDECIRSAHHAQQAIEMGACRIVNIKLGRVGGFREAIAVHDVCASAGIPVWCGGMLESGIGRAHNIALSTLPNFTLPGDVSASKRYWARDLIVPPVEVSPRGTIEVRDRPGFGYDIDTDFLRSVTVCEETIG